MIHKAAKAAPGDRVPTKARNAVTSTPSVGGRSRAKGKSLSGPAGSLGRIGVSKLLTLVCSLICSAVKSERSAIGRLVDGLLISILLITLILQKLGDFAGATG